MSARSVAFVSHIDIEPFRTGSEHDKRRVAREVGRACEEIGFLTIVGHGVPEEIAADRRGCPRVFRPSARGKARDSARRHQQQRL
jgi:isopenicillin N synthase-like dioxygenase